MTLGTLHHLSLRVSDRTRSEAFYDQVLGFLGYRRIQHNAEFTLWWSPQSGAITLMEDGAEEWSGRGDRPLPGLCHLAFNADSHEQVEALHQLLQDIGATILAPPTHPYQEAAGYSAVFFTDPDGLPLELVYMPLLP